MSPMPQPASRMRRTGIWHCLKALAMIAARLRISVGVTTRVAAFR
jgi:hypothetical protein